MKVHKKLKLFYNKNNFASDGGIGERWNKFAIGSFSFSLPNLNSKGYLMHDINHLLSEFGTDWFGEFEISAWELASGGRKGYGLSNLYTIVGFVLGLIVIPKRTILAFRLGMNRINAHVLSRKINIVTMDFDELYKLSFKSSK